MTIHIGKIIQETVRLKGMDVTEFANKINYTRRNIYKIFSKSSIDTDLLKKISKVLGENLFLKYVSTEEIASLQPNEVKAEEVMVAIKSLEAKIISNSVQKTNNQSKKKSRK